MSTSTPEYRALRAAHDRALRAYHNMPTPTDTAAEAEQIAWDALIVYVEAHGLNYTEFDPREGYLS